MCLLMNDVDISESIKTIQRKLDIIQNEWNKGESRKHLNFKK